MNIIIEIALIKSYLRQIQMNILKIENPEKMLPLLFENINNASNKKTTIISFQRA